MAKFVIAGKVDCVAYARAEMLADRLNACLPDFHVHKIAVPTEEWGGWVREECDKRGWEGHSGEVLVWRELVKRGGRGLYMGGVRELEEYASHYHDVTPHTDTQVEENIAVENSQTQEADRLEAESHVKPRPLRVTITAASSPLAYHLLHRLAEGGVFGDQLISLRLLDTPTHSNELSGVAMDVTDMASPTVASVHGTSSMQEAFLSASVVFILDYWEERKEVREEGEREGDERGREDGEKGGGDGVKKEGGAKEGVEEDSEEEGGVKEGVEEDGMKEEGGGREGVEEDGVKEESGGREGVKVDGEEQEEGGVKEGVEEDGAKEEGGVKEGVEEDGVKEESGGREGVKVDGEEQEEGGGKEGVEEDGEGELAKGGCSDLATAATLYHKYGATLDFCAQKDVCVIVTGHYANVGAAVIARSAPSLPPSHIVAAPCLAAQRAKSAIASKLGLNTGDIEQVCIWGRCEGEGVTVDASAARVRHYPGAIVGPDPFSLPLNCCLFDSMWLASGLTEVGRRRRRMVGGGGGMSEAVALADLVRQWWASRDSDSCRSGQPWHPVGVVSDGNCYGFPVGVVCSVPVKSEGGEWQVVPDLDLAPAMQSQLVLERESLLQELELAWKHIQSQT